jgi:hypothetical protein
MRYQQQKMLRHLEEAEAQRFFSLEQANGSLVLMRRIASDIVEQFQRLLALQAQMEQAQRDTQRETYAQCRETIRSAFGCLQSCRREIEQLGARLKDWGKGIVHFPYDLNGREVYLCWRHGEERIACWHEVGTCYDRRPIETLTGLGSYVPREPQGAEGEDLDDPQRLPSRATYHR